MKTIIIDLRRSMQALTAVAGLYPAIDDSLDDIIEHLISTYCQDGQMSLEVDVMLFEFKRDFLISPHEANVLKPALLEILDELDINIRSCLQPRIIRFYNLRERNRNLLVFSPLIVEI